MRREKAERGKEAEEKRTQVSASQTESREEGFNRYHRCEILEAFALTVILGGRHHYARVLYH